MSALSIVDPSEFIRRHIAATVATARGEAPPFSFARRWQPDRQLCALDDGHGAIGVKIRGEFEPFEPAAGLMDQDACTHAMAVLQDAYWLDLQTKFEAGAKLGKEVHFFILWGGIRDILRPWIETGEPLSPEEDAKIPGAWNAAEGVRYQALVLAFPQVAQVFARDRYKDTTNPVLREVVDLARARAGKATKH